MFKFKKENNKDSEKVKYNGDYKPNFISPPMKNSRPPIRVTKIERDILLYCGRYNGGYLFPIPDFLKSKVISTTELIESLCKKGFVWHDKITNAFHITRNIITLIKLEGDNSFDEILEKDKKE